MKLLKKLLPAATLACTAIAVAPAVTACSAGTVGGVSIKDYTAKYKDPKAALSEAVTADVGAKAYFDEKEAKEIIKDDVLLMAKKAVKYIDDYSKPGYSFTGDINVTKIDSANKLISFTVGAHLDGTALIPTDITNEIPLVDKIEVKVNANVQISVTDFKYTYNCEKVDDGKFLWWFKADTENVPDTFAANGFINLSATCSYANIAINTGNVSVDKNYQPTTIDPTDPKMLLAYASQYLQWVSTYYQNIDGTKEA